MDVREAYAASTSLNDLAGRLQCHYQTARKRALAEGLEVPAPHWSAQAERPETPAERLRHEIKIDRAKAKSPNEVAERRP